MPLSTTPAGAARHHLDSPELEAHEYRNAADHCREVADRSHRRPVDQSLLVFADWCDSRATALDGQPTAHVPGDAPRRRTGRDRSRG